MISIESALHKASGSLLKMNSQVAVALLLIGVDQSDGEHARRISSRPLGTYDRYQATSMLYVRASKRYLEKLREATS